MAHPAKAVSKSRYFEHVWTQHLKAAREFPGLNHRLFEPSHEPLGARRAERIKRAVRREMERPQ